MESGGGQDRGGWINESVYLVSVGGWVCVCVGVLSVGLGPGLDSMSPARSRRSASHAVSLSCRRSSKEQECARSAHSNISLVFSDETLQSHVVSPSY